MATTAPAGLLSTGSLNTRNRLSGSNTLASDGRSLDALRNSAAQDPKSAAREAARQFESLFTNELLKSMRASTEASGLMDNEATKLGQQMLDTQLSSQLAGRPGGLAEAIARQLERQMGVASGSGASSAASSSTASAGSAVASAGSWGRRATGRADTLQDPTRPDPAAQTSAKGALTGDAADFVQAHAKAAKSAESSTGIPASFMLAQAALETGWGKKTIVGADGTDSHNLFGIKAGSGWTGRTVDVTTTEYVGGQPLRVVQKFRAYASEAESFADYAKLMKTSPRYADAVASGGNAQAFAANLQKAGYATDPAYADKLGRVINTTLRLQRSQA